MLKKECSILIVEDEADFRTFLTILSKKIGAKSHAVASVVQAFEHLSTRPKIDLIISDYSLPGASGVDLISALKESGYDIPVILISAVKAFSDRELAEYGIKAFLEKPFTAEQLESAVRRCLADRAGLPSGDEF